MVPFKEKYKAEQLAFILLDRLVRDHGIPESITSDRDKLFTSNYWKTLLGMIGTKLRMSTAYHPQTDGQTERANQTLETYLRHYVNKRQNNWVQLLPMAQLAYNDKMSQTTGVTPFFANYGKHPNDFLEPRKGPDADKAMIKAEELKTVHQQLRKTITDSNEKVRKQADKNRKDGPQLKEGDKVYLLTKNMKIKRPSKKLDHVKVGPFLIIERRGPVNYKLELPKGSKRHPVFHVSLLEPADPSTPIQESFHYETEEEDEYEVEKILDQRGQKYLIKWKNCDDTENTWEPLRNLRNCQDLLQQFRQGQKRTNRS
jgi:transposase InsO family protein